MSHLTRSVASALTRTPPLLWTRHDQSWCRRPSNARWNPVGWDAVQLWGSIIVDPVKTLLTGGGNYFPPPPQLFLSELRWFLVNCSIFTEEAKGLGLRSESGEEGGRRWPERTRGCAQVESWILTTVWEKAGSPGRCDGDVIPNWIPFHPLIC